MRKAFFLHSIRLLPATVLVSFAVGCGSSGDGGGSPADAGGTDATTDTRSTADASDGDTANESEAPSDADAVARDGDAASDTDALVDADATDEAGVVPPTLLASGKFVLLGVTGDDHAIFMSADGKGGVQQVSLAPAAAPSVIDATAVTAVVAGNDVFLDGAGVATVPLSLWAAPSGLHTLAAASLPSAFPGPYFPQGLPLATSDGSHVVFLDNAAKNPGTPDTGYTADVAMANSDGSGKVIVFSGVQLNGAYSGAPTHGCPLLGRVVDDGFVLELCPTATSHEIDFVGIDGHATFVAADASLLSASSGPQIFFRSAGSPSDGHLVRGLGGTNTKIDSNVVDGVFSADGSTLLYTTSSTTGSSTIKKTATSAVAPETLAADVANLVEPVVSPSMRWIQYETTATSTATTSSIELIDAASAPPTPVLLGSTARASAVTGFFDRILDRFTADESDTFFVADSTVDVSTGWRIGSLQSAPVAGGATVTIDSSVFRILATTATKVVYTSNLHVATTGVYELRFDVRSVDLSAPSTLAWLADQATGFALDSTKTRLVYAKDDGPAPGLYVVSIP